MHKIQCLGMRSRGSGGCSVSKGTENLCSNASYTKTRLVGPASLVLPVHFGKRTTSGGGTGAPAGKTPAKSQLHQKLGSRSDQLLSTRAVGTL